MNCAPCKNEIFLSNRTEKRRAQKPVKCTLLWSDARCDMKWQHAKKNGRKDVLKMGMMMRGRRRKYIEWEKWFDVNMIHTENINKFRSGNRFANKKRMENRMNSILLQEMEQNGSENHFFFRRETRRISFGNVRWSKRSARLTTHMVAAVCFTPHSCFTVRMTNWHRRVV